MSRNEEKAKPKNKFLAIPTIMAVAHLVVCGTALFLCLAAQDTAKEPVQRTHILPGELWLDNHGVPINAHGGGLIFHQGRYYWFGEHKIEGR
jgi:hypothetical protein